MNLREGVVWSDGTPFTSADVLFTFEVIYDARFDSVLAGTLKIKGQPLKVTAPDAKTVVVTFPSTYGPGVMMFDGVPLVPKHKFQAALKAGTFAPYLRE